MLAAWPEPVPVRDLTEKARKRRAAMTVQFRLEACRYDKLGAFPAPSMSAIR